MTDNCRDALTFPATAATDGATDSNPTIADAAADVLSDLLHQGARRMLIQAVEAEARQWIDDHAHVTDDRRPASGGGQRSRG